MVKSIYERFPNGNWNVRCGKCKDRCSVGISEVTKEFPEQKYSLETGQILEKKRDGMNAICHSCGKKDIVEEREKNKTVSYCNQCLNDFKRGSTYYTLMGEGEKLAFCSKKCSSKYGEKLKEEAKKQQEHYANISIRGKQDQIDALTKNCSKDY